MGPLFVTIRVSKTSEGRVQVDAIKGALDQADFEAGEVEVSADGRNAYNALELFASELSGSVEEDLQRV